MRCPICEDELIVQGEAFVEAGEWDGRSQHYDEEFGADIYRCDNGHRILIAPQATPKRHPNDTQIAPK